jgi:hypothetical protein
MKFECEKCGYNRCNDALEFHHRNDKLFEINMIRTSFTDVKKLTERVENELNKCKNKKTSKMFFYSTSIS